jgi:hypothetical protein
MDEAPAPLAYRIFRDGRLILEQDHGTLGRACSARRPGVVDRPLLAKQVAIVHDAVKSSWRWPITVSSHVPSRFASWPRPDSATRSGDVGSRNSCSRPRRGAPHRSNLSRTSFFARA